MTYMYELIIDQIVRRRDYSQFKPNIITMIVQDLDRIDSTQHSCEFKITTGINYNSRLEVINYEEI